MNDICFSQKELLEIHVRALFTMDSDSKLVSINEPWDSTKIAPRFYIGKTLNGTIIYRFRYDIPEKIINLLENFINGENCENNDFSFKYLIEYLRILGTDNYFSEVCYYGKNYLQEYYNNCNKITVENIKNYELNGLEWLKDEIMYCQPCFGLIENKQVVSLCMSVRITENAHEAGIETIENYRGRNHAKNVLSAWMKEIQNSNCLALYSTNTKNKSSQRVAEKAFLDKYAIGISIE